MSQYDDDADRLADDCDNCGQINDQCVCCVTCEGSGVVGETEVCPICDGAGESTDSASDVSEADLLRDRGYAGMDDWDGDMPPDDDMACHDWQG